MEAWDGGLTREILFNKLNQYYVNLCTEGAITEENMERHLDKLELMDLQQLKTHARYRKIPV